MTPTTKNRRSDCCVQKPQMATTKKTGGQCEQVFFFVRSVLLRAALRFAKRGCVRRALHEERGHPLGALFGSGRLSKS